MPNVKFKLRRRGNKNNNQIQRMIKSMERLSGEYTEVGYFKSQGMHTGADGVADYSYTALAQALEIGFFPMLKNRASISEMVRTPMPFMNHIVNRTIQDRKRSVIFLRPWKNWRLNMDKNGSPDELLNAMGRLAVNRSKDVFDNKAYFPQAPQNATPLVETGELRKKYSYITSVNKIVRNRE